MALTRFGFHLSNTSYEGVPSSELFATIGDVVVAAEESGFDSIWVPDHVHQNPIGGGPSGSMPEAYMLLAALATRTERALLGAMVSPITFRSPGLLAKMVTTLDVISTGRAVLGIGAGWDEGEHVAYGIEFPAPRVRLDELEEQILICQAMIEHPQASHTGTHYSVEDAWNVPRPVAPKIPLLVGGNGEKRTLAIAARYGDACNLWGEPADLVHKFEVLAEHCARVGRDVAEITKTTSVMAVEDRGEMCRMVEERFAVGADSVVFYGGDCPSPSLVRSWGEALTRTFG